MLRLTLTLESDEQYHRWLDEINAVGEGQSRWICAMVEHALANPQDFGTALELQRLREEINELKAEKKLLEVALQKERSEIFKLKAQPTSGETKLNIAAILMQGGHWSQRELLEALQIDPVDIDALQIVRRQLDLLQDAGFVEDTGRGWKWTD